MARSSSDNTMRIELITAVNALDDTYYFELVPGKWLGNHWNRTSVYIDGDVFGLIAWLFAERVAGFDPYGPTEIARSRIDHLFKGLIDFSKTVGQAQGLADVWVPHPSSQFPGLYLVKFDGRTLHCYGASEALEAIDDWEAARRQIRLMLEELGRWMLNVSAQGKPVTILGV